MANRSLPADLVVLTLLVGLCLGIGMLGASLAEASIGTWYADLIKPAFTPPDVVFGPIWTVLYILMALAAWRVWRGADWQATHGPLTLFALQLALNLGWSAVFFGYQKIGAAVATIIVLDVAVLVTTLAFRTVDRMAALLMLPYLAWMLYATALNVAIWRLNPSA